MSKILTITMKNFKAISQLEVDFKGCTAIVTGGNDTGKTSFLRGMQDRIRFIRPDIPVKRGEKEGISEMTLDTGEKFVWEFNDTGKDKLTYVSEKGIKSSVTVELGARFFPEQFDIDTFLRSTPAKQIAQLQKLVGVDFTDINDRYAKAYAARTDKNREAERYQVKLTAMLKVDEVKRVDLTELTKKKEEERKRLDELYQQNKGANDKLRSVWDEEKNQINKDVQQYNTIQDEKTKDIERAEGYYARLKNLLMEMSAFGELIDTSKLRLHIDDMPKSEAKKNAELLYPKEPEYIDEVPDNTMLLGIDQQIITASDTNTKALAYETYQAHKDATDKAKGEAKEADDLVKSIEAERKKMIEQANFPEGISITADGITVDDLPLDPTQISTSKLYKSALRIGAMKLGEVKAMHFDASFMDRESLEEIERWADAHGYQLLIERPDFEGGEIKYVLVEHV